jgi:hypothetical protein
LKTIFWLKFKLRVSGLVTNALQRCRFQEVTPDVPSSEARIALTITTAKNYLLRFIHLQYLFNSVKLFAKDSKWRTCAIRNDEPRLVRTSLSITY